MKISKYLKRKFLFTKHHEILNDKWVNLSKEEHHEITWAQNKDLKIGDSLNSEWVKRASCLCEICIYIFRTSFVSPTTFMEVIHTEFFRRYE